MNADFLCKFILAHKFCYVKSVPIPPLPGKHKDVIIQHGMSYEQFDAYLKARSSLLAASPNPALNQAVMAEEEDAQAWKIAREMLQSWLGLQAETDA